MTGTKNGELQQMEELVDGSCEKAENIDLLGHLKCIVKLTGLDCTPGYSAKHGQGSKICGHFAFIFAIMVSLVMFYRANVFLGEEGKFMSFNWSEGNVFGFMGLHAFACSLCILGWTFNGRIPKHQQRLAKLRLLRREPNEEMDDYRGLRKKAFLFSLPWLATIGLVSVFNALQEKILYSGEVVPAYMYSLFAALAFLVWFITSTCLTYYNVAQLSMFREIEYFNIELKKATEEKKLKDHSVLAEFSYRQNELIKMVKKSNRFLKSYATAAPLFLFFSVICAIYNFSFFFSVPYLYRAGIIAFFACIIGWLILSLLPPAKVQRQLRDTSSILMGSEEFEYAEDPKVYQTYRIMVDRSLSSETRIFVVNAFGINQRNFHTAMFLVPNLGPLLMMLRKLLEYNGYDVSS